MESPTTVKDWDAAVSGPTLQAKIENVARFSRDVENAKNDFLKSLEEFCNTGHKEKEFAFQIESRTKSAESIKDSLNRREKELQEQQSKLGGLKAIFHEIHDLIGLKIVPDDPSDMAKVDSFIADNFYEEKPPAKFLANRLVGHWETWFGAYQTTNYRVSLRSRTDRSSSRFFGVMFEVQLTTLPEHLYNKFAHEFLYKGRAGPLTTMDEIELDLTHGISMCYGLCAMYMKEKLKTAHREGDKHTKNSDIQNVVSDGERFLQNFTIAENSRQERPFSQIPRSDFHSVKDFETWLDTKLENISQKLLKSMKEHTLSDKEEECRRSFHPSSGPSYEWYKASVPNRVPGTCQWFLDHENFRKWLGQDAGPLLVSADPGCGKSVLAEHLIDCELPKTEATVCYFFFKDQDQNTISQAFSALLHQLFCHHPVLIHHAMTDYSQMGKGLKSNPDALWRVLESAVRDKLAGPVIMVLDALDECLKSDFVALIKKLDDMFLQSEPPCKLRFLLTCRPYHQVVDRFNKFTKAFPEIRIPGEAESEAISREVELVIVHRAKELATMIQLNDTLEKLLVAQLRRVKKNRTYLWAYLVLDYLEEINFSKTRKAVEGLFSTLPKNVNEAYERILNKLDEVERGKARRALSIIMAASRPLSVTEMNFALYATYSSKSMDDLYLESEETFQSYLRCLCGLLVSSTKEMSTFSTKPFGNSSSLPSLSLFLPIHCSIAGGNQSPIAMQMPSLEKHMLAILAFSTIVPTATSIPLF